MSIEDLFELFAGAGLTWRAVLRNAVDTLGATVVVQ
jgi:hypothetical protein